MQYYDMHSHILPNIDDGAETVEKSIELLECLKKQKVTNVCFTPHFYTNEMSIADFVEKRRIAYDEFLPHKPKDINIVLGAEVFVSKYLFNGDDLSELTYGKSRCILTEFSYGTDFSGQSLHQLSMLIENYRFIPVIPHIERYEVPMADIGVLRELKDRGVIIQTNIGNYTNKSPFFKRRKLLKLIDEGLIDIIGSDAHSMHHNTPEVFSKAIEMISDKCGAETVKRMMQKAEAIFSAALD